MNKNWRDNCKNCPFFEDCNSSKSEKECLEFLNKEMNKNLKKFKFDKIARLIERALKKYVEYGNACQSIAREAQKYIDWDDNVMCMYYPSDGICIEIDAHVCPASVFFKLIDSEKCKIDKRTYLLNCI